MFTQKKKKSWYFKGSEEQVSLGQDLRKEMNKWVKGQAKSAENRRS